MSNPVDFVMLGDNALDLLERDIVALNASLAGSLPPVGRVTAADLIPLAHHCAVVLVDFDFLLLVHDVTFCRQLLV